MGSEQSKILQSLIGKKRPRSEVMNALTKVRDMNAESVKRFKTEIESFRLQVKGLAIAEDGNAAEFDAQILEDAEKVKAGEFDALEEMIVQAETDVKALDELMPLQPDQAQQSEGHLEQKSMSNVSNQHEVPME